MLIIYVYVTRSLLILVHHVTLFNRHFFLNIVPKAPQNEMVIINVAAEIIKLRIDPTMSGSSINGKFTVCRIDVSDSLLFAIHIQ